MPPAAGRGSGPRRRGPGSRRGGGSDRSTPRVAPRSHGPGGQRPRGVPRAPPERGDGLLGLGPQRLRVAGGRSLVELGPDLAQGLGKPRLALAVAPLPGGTQLLRLRQQPLAGPPRPPACAGGAPRRSRRPPSRGGRRSSTRAACRPCGCGVRLLAGDRDDLAAGLIQRLEQLLLALGPLCPQLLGQRPLAALRLLLEAQAGLVDPLLGDPHRRLLGVGRSLKPDADPSARRARRSSSSSALRRSSSPRRRSISRSMRCSAAPRSRSSAGSGGAGGSRLYPPAVAGGRVLSPGLCGLSTLDSLFGHARILSAAGPAGATPRAGRGRIARSRARRRRPAAPHSTSSPLRITPLRLRSSRTRSSSSSSETISAWRRETVGSSSRTSATALRPIRVQPRSSGKVWTSPSSR